jgi:type I restriction enzyme S subunit
MTIPNGWTTAQLEDGIDLLSGQHILASEYSDLPPGVPYLTGPADFPNGKIVVTKYTVQPKVTCKSGDILITIKGSGTGKIILADQAYCISRQLAAVRTKCWDSKFIFYFLQNNNSRYADAAAGLIPGIARDDILKTPISVPPLPEQRKIAEILSTWDEAIALTEQLIAAKQRRKQALMQRLLTGQVRFPGFEDEWGSFKAGELFESISIKNNDDDEQLLSVTQDRGVLPRDMLETRVVNPEGSTKGYKLIIPGNFIISLRSFQGGLEYSAYRGLVSPAYTVLQPKKKIINDFYRYYFKSYEFIGRLAIAVIGIRDGKQISYEDFCTLKLPCPTLQEQAAIADVLCTVDDEIALHQQKLAALRRQKQGLMQQLLTGRVRVAG